MPSNAAHTIHRGERRCCFWLGGSVRATPPPEAVGLPLTPARHRADHGRERGFHSYPYVDFAAAANAVTMGASQLSTMHETEQSYNKATAAHQRECAHARRNAARDYSMCAPRALPPATFD